MTQPTVFISYSPADEADKEALVTQLKVLQQQDLIETWTDDQIQPGNNEASEIAQAIERAKVAILLITPSFLSSEFVKGKDLQRLLERRKTQALVIYPIIARPCAWKRVPWLAGMRVRPRHEQPVWREGGRYVDEELAAIVEEIAAIMEKASAGQSTHENGAPSPVDPLESRGLVYGDPAEPVTQIKRRYALLIGVRDYAAANFRALPHTISDVMELDKLLRAANYTTRLLHSDLPTQQPTYSRIWGELENLAQVTEAGDLLLVYFGGHGDLDDEGNAYLIPTDLHSRAALKRTGINLADFTRTIVDSRAQARILILDACHSGIGRSGRGMDPTFERQVFLEATGSATLAACRRGEVAYDHDRTPHGVFTYYLLEGLRGAADRHSKGFVTFNDLKDYVTDQVKTWAVERGQQQWPNASTQLVGDPALLALAQAGS